MIRLCLFDLGKVLIDFDFSVAIERLSKIQNISTLKVFSLFRNSDLALRWDCGRLSSEDFFAVLQKELNLSLTQAEFLPLWNEIFAEKPEMVKLAKHLKRHKKVVVLSNTNPWHAQYLRQNHSWLLDFDEFVASCDVKMVKPDAAIYRYVLDRHQVSPEEVVYVDDIPEFIDAAKKLGMHAFLFRDHAQLLKDLQKNPAAAEILSLARS